MDNGNLAVPRDQPLILIVDDSPVVASTMAHILSVHGFSSRIAGTVAEGYSMAVELLPDLLLLDVILPDGDGFSLCELIIATASLSERPIIFVTSLEDVKSRVRGLSIGAVDFIQKPFSAEELVARVKIHLKVARQALQLAALQSERLRSLSDAHKSFLTNAEALPAAKCSVFFEAAEEAGGDQYDIVELSPGIHGYLVADISGHGIESAFQASVLKALFRENASVLNTAGQTMYIMNRALRRNLNDGQHVTAFYLILNRLSDTGSFACAGHFPALAVSQGGESRSLRAEGDILGAFEAPHFQMGNFRLALGDRYWLYTDGVLEDFQSGQSWSAGLGRLERAVSAASAWVRDEALAAVRSSIMPPGPLGDDRLLMAIDA
ncbi:MAG: fused response regulator/phosphatase [Spirochaetota bacterium]